VPPPHRAVVFFTALAAYAITAVRQNIYDGHEHMIQAWRWLHGSLNVDGFPIHETVLWEGHRYILHPPLASLMDLPFAVIYGPGCPQVLPAVVIGALAVALVYRATASGWITLFFAAGTAFGYEVTFGAAWGFCLVLSCVPTLLALIELDGKARPGWVGLWSGLAWLARYDLVTVWPIYAIWLWRVKARDEKKSAIVVLSATYATFILIYAAFAYLRFGTFADSTIALWYYHGDPAGAPAHPGIGPFSIRYLPANFFTILFLAPNYSAQFPWMRPTPIGQCVLLTSPAFLLAFRSSIRDYGTWLLWIAVVLSMSASMLVWSNGQMQFGCRYLIQAYPFLIALISRGWRKDQLARALILLSLLLTASGTAVIRLYGWG
jgi:hypothetical protein